MALGRPNATFSRIVPSKRNVSCSTTPNCVRYELSRTVERSTPSTEIDPVVGLWKAAISPMMVDLPDPEEPTRAVTVPGSALKLDPVQHGLAVGVLERHVPKLDYPSIGPIVDRTIRILVFRVLIQHFARPLQSGEGFGDLRPDLHDLKHGRNQESKERRKRDEPTERDRARRHLSCADIHHHSRRRRPAGHWRRDS